MWVPQRLEGRMRPVKLPVYAIRITDFGEKQEVTYLGPDGRPFDAEVYPTIEMCEKAINIIESHTHNFTEAMKALRREADGGPVLVDATGKKMI